MQSVSKTVFPTLSIQDQPELLDQITLGKRYRATIEFEGGEMSAHVEGQYYDGDGCRIELKIMDISDIVDTEAKVKPPTMAATIAASLSSK